MSKRKANPESGEASTKRLYSVEFLKFGFIKDELDEKKPYCLMCRKALASSSMKRNILQVHFAKRHPELADKPLEYFQKLYQERQQGKSTQRQPTIISAFNKVQIMHSVALETSYHLSWLLGKESRPHTDGENVIIPALKIYHSMMVEKGSTGNIGDLPLSNDSVRRRIDECADDVKSQLCNILRRTKFSLALDETTVLRCKALLLTYVRFEHNSQLMEEMLFCESFKDTTTAKDIYNLVINFFAKNDIPLNNIVSVAADGAPSMMGKRNGFLKLLKDENPSIMSVHCVIHRENLVAAALAGELNIVLSKIIGIVNCIKRHPKNERIFANFCKDMDSSYVRLLLHTKIRWLSKGNFLKRFVSLYDSIVEFLDNSEDKIFLIDADNKAMVFYLADIFGKLNELNKDLQGKKKTMIECKTNVSAFINKLGFLSTQISTKRYSQFPFLATCEVSDRVIQIILFHLKSLKSDFEQRFEDLISLTFPTWMSQPFIFEICCEEGLSMKNDVLDELFKLQQDDNARAIFSIKRQQMWFDDQLSKKYPYLCKESQKNLLPFPTTYIVECAFSSVSDLLSDKRSSLDITNRGDLRAVLTNLVPRFSYLSSLHQPQGSH